MRKVNVPVMGHLLFLFMTIECSQSVHSIVIGNFKILLCFSRSAYQDNSALSLANSSPLTFSNW